MVVKPRQVPIGLRLSQSARLVAGAFDDALSAAGGSLPIWLILLNLKIRQVASQRDLAAAVGIREATLTNHLNVMENRGLLTRRRDPANRRVHQVEPTPAGEALFLALRQAAAEFDHRLRAGLTDHDIDALTALLTRIVHNVTEPSAGAPWAGLAEQG